MIRILSTPTAPRSIPMAESFWPRKRPCAILTVVYTKTCSSPASPRFRSELSAGACNQLIIAPSAVGARVGAAAQGCRGRQQEEQEESDRSRRCRKEERGVSTHRAGPPPPAFIFNQLRRQSPAILERSRARSSGICRRGLLRHVTALLATARANLNPPTRARTPPPVSSTTSACHACGVHPVGQRPLHEVAAVPSYASAASAPPPRRLCGSTIASATSAAVRVYCGGLAV
ncbi:hypothetical protein MRX96_038626 [Rhipicephalus microplus]